MAAACHRQTEADIQFLTKVETTFENDMTQSLPDFSSPAVIDPDCIVPDMPEDVVWVTSKPKDLGSPDTKTGGIFRTAIPYYPVTFRSAELQTPIKNGYINRYMFNYLSVVGLKGIFLNTRSKLLSNKNIRKALYYALDMQGMIGRSIPPLS